MLIKNEKQLLSFIKYSPIAIIVVISLIINFLIYFQNEHNFQKDLKVYKENYIETNKKITKLQVDKTYDDILAVRRDLEKNLELNLKKRVDEAVSIVKNLHEKFSYLKEEELLKIIKESLNPIRFNRGRGYFYITDRSGKIISHPIKKDYENKNIFDLKDFSNKDSYEKLKNHFKINNNYVGYLNVTKPEEDSKEYKKLSYIKLYEPLNITIGTGEYIDEFTKEMKTHIIKEHIENFRYGGNSYIFIFDYDGYQLSHIKKSYIGKQRLDLKDSNGFMITQEIIKQAKKGSGFISYIGSILPETGKPAQKTTYIRGVQDWGWAIGSGFYNYDLEKYLKIKKEELIEINSESLKTNLIITFILTIILITIAFYVSNVLEEAFLNYQKKIKKQINENRKKDLVLFQQSKMASMGEMIGNIAHQWRQPLSTVSTLASGTIIKKEVGTLEDNELLENMNLIVDTTKHLSQTIDDFREFFNPHKVKKEIDTVSLHNKAIQLVSSRLTSHDIELLSDIDSTRFFTFENELLQCIMNILNNAIDALSNTNLDKKYLAFNVKYQTECKMPNCEIEECTPNKEGYLNITIQDNAGGIKEDVINKIFDAYFTTKHKSQGTGIGLYMTYEIINKHLNGFISAENKKVVINNKEYIGAMFTIILPSSS